MAVHSCTAVRHSLEWSIYPEWDEWARHSEGCYVLRTNVRDWDAETLWRTYVQLSQAEAAFRIHKSELSIRPVWHWKERRVRSHILVSFLAYVLWKTLEHWQSKAASATVRAPCSKSSNAFAAPTWCCR